MSLTATEVTRLREEILARLEKKIDSKVEAGYAFLRARSRLGTRDGVLPMDHYFTGGARPEWRGTVGRGALSSVERVAIVGGSVPEEYRQLVRKDIIVPDGALAYLRSLQAAGEFGHSLGRYLAQDRAGKAGGCIIDVAALKDIGVNVLGTPREIAKAVMARKRDLEEALEQGLEEIADQVARPIWLSADRGLQDVILPVIGTETVVRERASVSSVLPEPSLTISKALDSIMLKEGPQDGERSRISQYQLWKPCTMAQAFSSEVQRLYRGERKNALIGISTLLLEQARLYLLRQEAGWLDRDAKPQNILGECGKDGVWKLCLIDQGMYAPSPSLGMTAAECSVLSTAKGMMTSLYAPYRRLEAVLRWDYPEMERADVGDDAVHAALSHAGFFGAYDAVRQTQFLTREHALNVIEARTAFVNSRRWPAPGALQGVVRLTQQVLRDDLAGKSWSMREYESALQAEVLAIHGGV